MIGTIMRGGENSQPRNFAKNMSASEPFACSLQAHEKVDTPIARGTPPKPTKTEYTVRRQIVQWIPSGMIQRLADEHKLDIRKPLLEAAFPGWPVEAGFRLTPEAVGGVAGMAG